MDQILSESSLHRSCSDIELDTVLSEDFAVAIGIGSPDPTFVPPQLGNEILRVFNLRHRAPVTPHGNYTLKVPLNSSEVGSYQSPGQYVITAGVLAGVGARYGAQLNVFNQTIELKW